MADDPRYTMPSSPDMKGSTSYQRQYLFQKKLADDIGSYTSAGEQYKPLFKMKMEADADAIQGEQMQRSKGNSLYTRKVE